MTAARGVSGSAVFLLYLLALAPLTGYANPTGAEVVAGQASVTGTGSSLVDINQATHKAIINWQSFSNASGETVRFTQPSSTAVALNRVVGVDPSTIAGRLEANGRIFLINPNGVVFTSTARVDVAGLLATTLQMSDRAFFAGTYQLEQDAGKPLAALINRGRITARERGEVVLIAPLVSNEGQIVAAMGQVAIGATTRSVVSIDGQGLVNFAVGETGRGDVVLPTGYSTSLFQQVVNTSRIVRAGSLEEKDGKVVLARAEGVAINGGEINVDGVAGNKGGRVRIDSSQATVLAPGSTVTARGGGAGSAGGDIRALSNGSTVFAPRARLDAQAGSTGNGGFVEVSGKTDITLDGDVDVSARAGQSGTLLIDPADIRIINGGPGTGSQDGTVTANNQVLFADPDLGANTVSEQTLEAIAPGSTIFLQAGNSITLSNLADNRLSLSFGTTLVLQTQTGRIVFDDANDTISASGSGSIFMNAGLATGAVAELQLGTLSTASGSIVLSAGACGGDVGFRSLLGSQGEVNVRAANGSVIGGNITGGAGTATNAAVALHAGGNDAGDFTPGATGSVRVGSVRTANGPIFLSSAIAGGDVAYTDVDVGNSLAFLQSVAGEVRGGDVTGGKVLIASGPQFTPGTVFSDILASFDNNLALEFTNLGSISVGTVTARAGDALLLAGKDIRFSNIVSLTGSAGATSFTGNILGGSVIARDSALAAAGFSAGGAGTVLVNNVDGSDITVAGGLGSGDVRFDALTAGSGPVTVVAGTGSIIAGTVSGGEITMATLGSILDGNGDALNLVSRSGLRSTLVAGGIIGTDTDPLDVNINTGSLSVSAGAATNGVSVSIKGTIAPSNALLQGNTPPGRVIFNGRAAGAAGQAQNQTDPTKVAVDGGKTKATEAAESGGAAFRRVFSESSASTEAAPAGNSEPFDWSQANTLPPVEFSIPDEPIVKLGDDGRLYFEDSDFGIYSKQCTKFVIDAFNKDAIGGNDIPTNWGNAADWPGAARAAHYRVDDRPAVGAIIAVPYKKFDKELGQAKELGHVGIVEGVKYEGAGVYRLSIVDANGGNKPGVVQRFDYRYNLEARSMVRLDSEGNTRMIPETGKPTPEGLTGHAIDGGVDGGVQFIHQNAIQLKQQIDSSNMTAAQKDIWTRAATTWSRSASR